ncbi:hypothetical protein [Pandoraea sp. NPDC090278]|uniref:hypothetical protein n=1 Tax=Pandoraea sp. NPDC090278 TaxID=3364391 RepID=UPI00383B5B86
MIVLYNANSYLGGGETLFVRFCEYLDSVGEDYIAICGEGSFIEQKLAASPTAKGKVVALGGDLNYFYLTRERQEALLTKIAGEIGEQAETRFVTFCMRDLHLARALSRRIDNMALSHLILHIQDDLYLGQTLVDKARYVLTKKRSFGNRSLIDFNRTLLKKINDKEGLICMAQVIADHWERTFNVHVPTRRIVPLPSFSDADPIQGVNAADKSIIWIGRIVDFKIPAICAMVEFLGSRPDYTLTIVGNGDKSQIDEAIRKFNVDPARVRYVGEMPYDKIRDEIVRHSIGYAMGTSLVELARYRIPVVIALASYDHALFDKAICGGLFYDKPLGCDGSELMNSAGPDVADIATVIDAVESDYQAVAEKCYTYAKTHYSVAENFAKYVEIIKSTQKIAPNEFSEAQPQANALRRLAFNAASQ